MIRKVESICHAYDKRTHDTYNEKNKPKSNGDVFASLYNELISNDVNKKK